MIKLLASAESETDRMIRLVNDLLLLTRADSQALNLVREPVDIVEVARSIIAQMEPQAQLREIAEKKLPDLNTDDIEKAMRIVEGTAKAMGLEIE